MTAFGPYKNKETIDFTKLHKHHLFVISGATGAGKTSIFDGICFALFGTASGSDRENTAMLRSHFADDDTHTSVEFIFALNNKTYRIFRQLGHVKEGNKTKTGERYEFFEQVADGTEVPCVERQIVSEINAKLEAIIGLTEDQFKQIVMLPQGEFRKLLTSETENKEAILRRLFKTERYMEMNHLLKEKREAINQRFLQEKQMLDHYVQSIPSKIDVRDDTDLFHVLENEYVNIEQILSALGEEKIYLQEKISEDEKKYEKALRKFDQQQRLLHKAITTNERFQLLDEKQLALQNLEGQKITFLRKENQVKAAERASQLEPYEIQVIDRRTEYKETETFVQSATKELKAAENELNQIKKQYKAEENKADEREKIKRELTKYKEFLPTVQAIDQTKQQLDALKQEVQKSSNQLCETTKLLEKKEGKAEKLKIDIAKKDRQISEHGKKQEERYQLRLKYKVLHDYQKLRKKHYEVKKELQDKERIYTLAEQAYQEKETVWLQHQAAVLASNLEKNEPCPVCGSIHHPQKAFSGQKMSKEEIDEAKSDLDRKQKTYQTVLAQYRSYTEQLKDKAQEVTEYQVSLEHVKQEINVVVEKGKKLNAEVEHLDKVAVENKTSKSNLQKLELEGKQIRIQKEQIEAQLFKNRTAFTTLKATFDERLRNIPEDIRNLTALQTKISEMETEKNRLESKWENIQKQLQHADKAYTTAKVNIEHGNKRLQRAQDRMEKAENVFQNHLRNAQFENETSYQKAKLSTEARQKLQKEIEAYHQETVTLQKQIAELQEELKEKKRVDVDIFKQQVQQFKEMYEKALEQLNKSKKYYEAASELHENIINVQAQTEALETELANVSDLYDVLRGQNMKKISFERYLQIDYLDQITAAANERFKTLTNGQFYLIRSDRQEARGKQSGLAIDVYDGHTGQTRDVKTLSGGEKFIASLSLALGMSDVIQSFQGSISMDTMFIDEGFGSLDEESLHKSIDALISLQKTGRMIGVISHVEELKTIFPAMLEVNKTKEGYSKTKIVIK